MLEAVKYIVMKIDGDYAHLQLEGDDDSILVARALLPFEVDEGTILLWENFEYTVV